MGRTEHGASRWGAGLFALGASAATTAVVAAAFLGGGAPAQTRDGGPARPGPGEVLAAYSLYHPGKDESEIWVVSAGGSASLRIEGSSPELSPGGERVVFVGDIEDPGNVDIYTVGTDGAGLRRLTSDPQVDTSPSWSPDGQRIVYEREDGEGHAELFIIAADGTSERRLTRNDETNDTAPDWSPDGGTILFARFLGTNAEILAVDPTGKDLRRLTSSAGYDGAPVWSPDGRWIAFVRDPEEDGSMDLWVMARDGSGAQLLEKGSDWILSPAWTPDGSAIWYVTGAAFQGEGHAAAVGLDGSRAPLEVPPALAPSLEAGWEIVGFDLLEPP